MTERECERVSHKDGLPTSFLQQQWNIGNRWVMGLCQEHALDTSP